MSRADRGALSVELVVLFPVVLSMVFLVVQGACVGYDHEVALSAAREGAAIEASGTPNGDQGADAAAASFVNANAVLNDGVYPSSSNTGDEATMTVTMKVRWLLGALGTSTVTETMTVPTERFVGVGQ